MGLITREDHRGRQTALYRASLRGLARKLREGKCLLFIGAGASIDEDAPDLPTAKELSRELIEECGLEWHDQIPLSQAAYYYEFFYGRDLLNEKLVERIGDEKIAPPASIERLVEILSALKSCNVSTVAITTNYDQHFERAYKRKFGYPPKVIIYKGGTDPLEQNAKLNVFLPPYHEDDGLYWQPKLGCSLYKMHGCISQARDRGLVITEEDYINFLTNAFAQADEHKKMLNAMKGKLESSTILFVGYSLSDWNFRAIFKATVEKRQRQSKSYAVQFRETANSETELMQTYWNSLSAFWERKDVDVINVGSSEEIVG
jgi:SIR2-like domain